MTVRSIPDSFDPAIVAAIDARLDAIARDVRVLLAVESGSRAWGFASPDSDYDCRFVYLRRRDRYLSLWPARDVIETPLDGLLDVNGWDVAKAIRLIVKGNAVVIEWLRSPITYRGDADARARLGAFAVAHAPADAVRRHYRHLGLRQWRRHGDGPVSGKKLLYALRPAAAVRWMRLHGEALPPMHFPTLLDECAPDAAVRDAVDALLAAKARTRELGALPIAPAITAFIEAELDAAALPAPLPPSPDLRATADALFRDLLDRFAPA